MKIAIFALLLGIPAFSGAGDAKPPVHGRGEVAPPTRPDILVGVYPDNDDEFEEQRLSVAGTSLGHDTYFHDYRLKLRDGVSVQEALETLRQQPEIRYAEENGLTIADSTPNDYYYAHALPSEPIGAPAQYGPQTIHADAAWDIWSPRHTIVIAILDTGIDDTHPDLTNKIYQDGSGVIGYNAIANPLPSTTRGQSIDLNGHGTHCAGIAAAQINNDTSTTATSYPSIAGIAGWTGSSSDTTYIKIMPVKVLDQNAAGSPQNLGDGIQWAVDHGANVLSMSLHATNQTTHLDTDDTYVRDRIQYAWNKGCLLVASAGNTGTTDLKWPAAYSVVISVGATDHTDTLAGFSEYGSWVNVGAPGGKGADSNHTDLSDRILSTGPTDPANLQGGFAHITYYHPGYDYDSGTSMSCPHVAGEAALLWAQNPSLTNAQIKSLITSNTDSITSFVDSMSVTHSIGGGRINAYRALLAAKTDFNKNGVPDFVLNNPSTGDVAMWYMGGTNGDTVSSGAYVSSTLPSGWVVAGTGDFNGDGITDLVLNNPSTGDVAIWYMSGTSGNTVSSGAYASSTLPSGWVVAGVGDFNGDGKPDLVLNKTSTGDVAFWYMGGTYGNTVLSGAYADTTLPSGWVIAGVGNFNNDATLDLALYNPSTGDVGIWYMSGANGNLVSGGASVSTTLPSGWVVAGVGDFNGDGKPDLVLNKTSTGDVAFWYMGGANGSTVLGGSSLATTMPSGWVISGPR